MVALILDKNTTRTQDSRTKKFRSLESPRLKMLLIVLLTQLSHFTQAHAQSAPDPRSWATEYLNTESQSKVNKYFPHKVILVSGWKDKFYPVILEVDKVNFDEQGRIKSVPADELEWAYKLNFWPEGKKVESLSLEKRATQALMLSGGDSAIIFPARSSKSWRFVHWNGESVDLNITFPPSSSRSSSGIRSWLAKMLGYRAVVLDSRGDYVLVANITEEFDGTLLQGLVINGSSEKLRVKEGDSEGIGLISFVKGRGNFAVFQVIFLEKGISSIPPGSKLILEKME